MSFEIRLVCVFLIGGAPDAGGTVSDQGWHTLWGKFFFSLPTLVFSLATLDLITWMGKDPPVIT